MVATTMPGISELFERFKRDFPYHFALGDDFQWSAASGTITHPLIERVEHLWSLLHEIAHAELAHATYELDIHLIGLESTAWEWAVKHLAPAYDLSIDPDYIQDHMDTYRLWLHKRSLCPRCNQNGFQTNTKTYSCVNCRFLWRANDARICGLRRTRLPSLDQT